MTALPGVVLLAGTPASLGAQPLGRKKQVSWRRLDYL